jgi:hypothetical protein
MALVETAKFDERAMAAAKLSRSLGVMHECCFCRRVHVKNEMCRATGLRNDDGPWSADWREGGAAIALTGSAGSAREAFEGFKRAGNPGAAALAALSEGWQSVPPEEVAALDWKGGFDGDLQYPLAWVPCVDPTRILAMTGDKREANAGSYLGDAVRLRAAEWALGRYGAGARCVINDLQNLKTYWKPAGRESRLIPVPRGSLQAVAEWSMIMLGDADEYSSFRPADSVTQFACSTRGWAEPELIAALGILEGHVTSIHFALVSEAARQRGMAWRSCDALSYDFLGNSNVNYLVQECVGKGAERRLYLASMFEAADDNTLADMITWLPWLYDRGGSSDYAYDAQILASEVLSRKSAKCSAAFMCCGDEAVGPLLRGRVATAHGPVKGPYALAAYAMLPGSFPRKLRQRWADSVAEEPMLLWGKPSHLVGKSWLGHNAMACGSVKNFGIGPMTDSSGFIAGEAMERVEAAVRYYAQS